MSIRDEDKTLIVKVAKKMQDAGLRLIGTRGTAMFLSKNGIKMEVIKKVSEGEPNIVDLVHNKEVNLIVTLQQANRP